MTQQYIVGELSSLLGDLQPVPCECALAVCELRREVESSPLRLLPELAQQALCLTDAICWASLDRGEVSAFVNYAKTGVALREFAENAGLVR